MSYVKNLSPAIKTAYFKLHQGREYDRTDLRVLSETGMLAKSDIPELKRLFELEYEQLKEKFRKSYRIIGLRVATFLAEGLRVSGSHKDMTKKLDEIETWVRINKLKESLK